MPEPDIPEQYEWVEGILGRVEAEIHENRELMLTKFDGASTRQVITAGILIILSVVAASVLFISIYLRPILNRQDCNNRAEAAVFTTIKDAFATPPAPAEERIKALVAFEKAVDKFKECA